MNLEQARNERDAILERIGATSEEYNGFATHAAQHLALYAFFNEEFPAFRVVASYAGLDHLPQPKDSRAWGAIFMKAIKAGMIERIGYVQHPERHASPAPLYRSKIVGVSNENPQR
jgi:hypothetical protein